MARSHQRSIFLVITLALALGLALTVAELFARGLSPTYRRLHTDPLPFIAPHETRLWTTVKNFEGDVRGVHFRINSLGFRGPEISREKPAGVYRVLVLGDSIVMGSGLTEEVLVSSRLAESLRKQGPGRTFEAINAGVSGYGIREERLLFEEEGLALGLDAAVIVFCVNDVPDVTLAEQINPLRDLPIPAKTWLLDHSALALLLQGLYNETGLKKPSALSRFLAADRSPRTRARIEQGWSEYEALLARMNEECKRRGIALVLVAAPHGAQFADAQKRFLPQKRLAATCKQLGVPFIDLAPAFSALPSLPFFFPDPVHPSPEGHELMAEEIAEALAPVLKKNQGASP